MTGSLAAVDARIASIRTRFASLHGAAADPMSAGPALGGSDQPVGFDPFGAAYQAAVAAAGFPGVSSAAAANALPVGVVPGIATGTEAVSNVGASRQPAGGGALTGAQVAQYAYNAGFRGQSLVDVVAISKRESNWTPTAFNGNAATNDLSYGLMQINMKGGLGAANLARFGLTSNEQLLDPQTNMRAAYVLYQAAGGSLNAWGGYKGASNTFGTDLAGAQQAVADAGLATAA